MLWKNNWSMRLLIFFFFNLLGCFNVFAATTWQPLNQGLINGGRITAVSIHSKRSNEIIAGTFFGGLYKSKDAANTWFNVADNLFQGTYISAIAFNPHNPDEIYVGTEQKGILKTQDAGQHWQAVNAGLNTLSIRSIVVNPANANEVYASSFYSGLFKSINGGKTWTQIAKNLKADFFGDIEINPNLPTMLLLQAWPDFDQNALYKSVDDGENWSQLSNIDFYTFSMQFSPFNLQAMYASTDKGFFKSEDGGSSWVLLFKPHAQEAETNLFAFDPNQPRTIYLNVLHEGLYKTQDDGKNWRLINNTFAEDKWSKLAINPINANEMYITTDHNGLFHSMDGGVHWNQANNGILNLSILSLATSSSHVLYAGTNQQGLWIKHEGENWIPSAAQFAHDSISHIAVDPKHPANLIMLVNKDPRTVYNDIYYSHDAGVSWQRASVNVDKPSDFIPMSLAINPVNPSEMFAGGNAGDIWKSQDGGASWILWSKMGDLLDFIYNIIINPKNPTEMYVGTMSDSGQLAYKSLDGGKTWTRLAYQFGQQAVNRDFNHLYAMAIDPLHPSILYASARVGVEPQDIHFYKSVDSGKNWSVIGKGLPLVEMINTIIVNPVQPNILYAATGYYDDSANLPSGDGVYVSYDAGENWSPFNAGLNNPFAIALAFDENKLYVGTEGSGVYLADAAQLAAKSTNTVLHARYQHRQDKTIHQH